MQTCAHSDKGLCPSCFRKKYTKKPLQKKPGKPLKRTPLKKATKKINKVSKKRAAQIREYNNQAAAFFKANPYCKAQLEGCTKIATERHHMQGKENDLLLDESLHLPICGSCHKRITEHSQEAIEKGLSVSRHKKTDIPLTLK